MSQVNLLKKMSAKTIIGKIEPPEKQTDLFAIYGVATGTKTGSSTFGDWLAFIGDFEGVHMESGEVNRSPVCFLPEPAQGMLEAALLKNENGVEFSFIIGVKPNKTSTTGYEYTVKPVVASKQNDALEKLRTATVQALPPPVEKVLDRSKPAKK